MTGITFATMNIACGADGYNCKKLDEIALFIDEHAIDFCALQEVDRYAQRSSNKDISWELLERSSMKYVRFGESLYNEFSYGNCILSKHKISESHCYALTPVPNITNVDKFEAEGRSVLIIKVECNGENIYVGTTHLAHTIAIRNSKIRQHQVKLINRIIDKTIGNAPFVFGGDFNTTIENNETDLLPFIEKYKCDTENAHAGAQYRAVDHVFSRGLDLQKCTIISRPMLSDHPFVVVTYCL